MSWSPCCACIVCSSSTTANVHDLTASEQLLHGEEVRVWGDAGYGGMEKREVHKDRQVAWRIAMGPSQGRRLAGDELERLMEECKSSVRAKWAYSEVPLLSSG